MIWDLRKNTGGGGGVVSGSVEWVNVLNKPSLALKSDLRHKITKSDYPHVQKQRGDGSLYIMNIVSGNTGTVQWSQRASIK